MDSYLTDEHLVERYYAADQEALGALFDRYKLYLFNYALRILKNRADAEDVVSDVFTQICQKKYTPMPQVKFKTWAFKVAHHAAIDRIRLRQKSGTLNLFEEDDQPIDVPDSNVLVSEHMDQAQINELIKNCIERLPLDQREALLLREYQDMSYDQISQVLGVSLENVKVLIYRARQHLKNQLPPLLWEGR